MLAFFPRYANLDTPVSYSETFVSEAVPSGERRIHIYIYTEERRGMSSASGDRPFCQPDLCGKYLQGGASPSLFNGLVGLTFCFSRHSNHSIVRYHFNSLETVSSSRGGLLSLVPFPEGPRGGNFREGLVLDRYRCPGDDDCVVGRSLMFVWCV